MLNASCCWLVGTLILSGVTSQTTLAQDSVLVGLVRPEVIGAMTVPEAVAELRVIGETEIVEQIRSAGQFNKNVEFSELQFRGTPIYRYTSHAFGFISPGQDAANRAVPILDAGNVQPDENLKGASIRVTLDRLRVYDYPGRGERRILVNFHAQHQIANAQKENLQFTQTYRATEGGGAGITGYPVFIGLRVPNEGVAFQIYTVNVENTDDRRILDFMDNQVFKNGLELLNSTNPLVPVVTSFATGITRSFATRNNNVPVQDIYMGLDFSNVRTRAKLKAGSYIVVQVPDGPWDWSKWVYNPATGQVVSQADSTQMIPYNYVVFSVSKM